MGRLRTLLVVLLLVLALLPSLHTQADAASVVVRVGIITDVHVGNQGSEARLEDFVNVMNQWKPDFVIQLGDAATGYYADSTHTTYATAAELDRFRVIYDKLIMPHYWVAGNHDVDVVSIEDWKFHTGAISDQYVLNYGGMRFIVINTEIPAEQVVGFLEPQLSSGNITTIVFGHKPLYTSNTTMNCMNGKDGELMLGADSVTQLLASSNNTKMYICGHLHQNDYVVENGIEYMALFGSLQYSGVQTNGFSALTFYSDGSYYLKGYGGQMDRGKKSDSDNQVYPEYIPSIPSPASAPPEPPIYYPPGSYSSGGFSGSGIVSVTPAGEKRTTSLLGVTGHDGTIWDDVEVLSADCRLSLNIPKRTVVHNKQGGLLMAIKVLDTGSRNGTISHVYELQPSGATFSQPLELRIKYKPTGDDSLFIALKKDNDWKALESSVDTKAQLVSANVTCLSTFAILTASGVKENEPIITDEGYIGQFDYRLTWAWFWYCINR